MSLLELSVQNLRCLEHAHLELDSRHNLIWGPNASGKTSLLESIFVLGRGRSFRTRSSERLIRAGKEETLVFGKANGTRPHAVGVQISRKEATTAKLDGEFVSGLAELSLAFAVQVIEPGIHRLVEEGAYRRRRWMDWAVFHVEPQFIENWTRYTRALKQRNAALRAQASGIEAWDPEITRLGDAIAEARRASIDRLRPYWEDMVMSLLGVPVELQYARGWIQGLSFAEALSASRGRDRARGMTHAGPHRADIVLRVNGKPARDVLSRGQQKLVGIAMTLAQLKLLKAEVDITPTLLLDDPAAELDRPHLERFAQQVAALQCQRVVTALSQALDPLGVPNRVFHVEHGRLLPV